MIDDNLKHIKAKYPNNSFDKFQELVNQTYYFAGETKREELIYLALATNAEAGEMGDEIKKMMRDDNGELTEERKIKIQKEMGDTIFYMAILASKLKFNFSDVAIAELEKLDSMVSEWEAKTGLKFTPDSFKHNKQNSKK